MHLSALWRLGCRHTATNQETELDLGHLFFSFDGRINRAKWWLGLILLSVVYGIVVAIFGYDTDNLLTLSLLALLWVWPSLAISIKRWHDRGKSGWWVLIGLVPIIGPLWALIETGFLPGIQGPNEYGADPIAG